MSEDISSYSIVHDLDKCILCRKCENVCNEVKALSLSYSHKGKHDNVISSAFLLPINETNCTFCGQCLSVCPTGALTEVNNTSKLWDALNNKNKFVIVQISPDIRSPLNEQFGIKISMSVTGKVISALRSLGFDKVFNTDLEPDLTSIEKISIAKNYYSKKMNIPTKNIIAVSVIPFESKNFERNKSELSSNTDIIIDVRELCQMIKEAGIHLPTLKDEEFDRIH